MDENNQPGTSIPVPTRIQQALVLLTLLTSQYGVTFNVYTSKRTRCWVSFKTWNPALFVTSVELVQVHGPEELADAMIISGVHHLLMLRGVYTPGNIWLDLRDRADAERDAYSLLDGILRGERPEDLVHELDATGPTEDAIQPTPITARDKPVPKSSKSQGLSGTANKEVK